jgi:2'-5' RNA ligase
MPYAVTLRLDAAATASVIAMWNDLRARGLSDEAASLGYPPHMTLAVFPDGADLARILAAVDDHAGEMRALTISLASIGLFPGKPAVLFLAPVVTRRLLAVHSELLTSLPDEVIEPYYQPDRWVPHVTLAGDLSSSTAALAVSDTWLLPIAAVLDTLDVVQFRPVRVLRTCSLAG